MWDRQTESWWQQFTGEAMVGKLTGAELKEISSVTVFFPQIDDKILTFKKSNSNFMDEQTASLWNITGKCIEGHYKGRALRPIPHGNHFAFSWFAFYPDSEIYEIE